MRINQLVAQLQESVRQQASMIDDQGARLRNLETVIARALVIPPAPGAAGAIAVSVQPPNAICKIELLTVVHSGTLAFCSFDSSAF